MRDLQKFTVQYHKDMNWEISKESYKDSKTSLLTNYMLLTTEVAEVAEELRRAFNLTIEHMEKGADEDTAFEWAKQAVKQDIGKEFADCLAYICKIANFFEIDLEQSFYEKMEEVKNRVNKDK
ncbi:MazG nucleotide pyrophosphohydrolase domain-containing protein [Neobacillus sp. Marseille-QA0830]